MKWLLPGSLCWLFVLDGLERLHRRRFHRQAVGVEMDGFWLLAFLTLASPVLLCNRQVLPIGTRWKRLPAYHTSSRGSCTPRPPPPGRPPLQSPGAALSHSVALLLSLSKRARQKWQARWSNKVQPLDLAQMQHGPLYLYAQWSGLVVFTSTKIPHARQAHGIRPHPPVLHLPALALEPVQVFLLNSEFVL